MKMRKSGHDNGAAGPCYNLLYVKMSSSVLTLDDAVANGNFVSWSADDFTNDTSLIVSSDRWIF